MPASSSLKHFAQLTLPLVAMSLSTRHSSLRQRLFGKLTDGFQPSVRDLICVMFFASYGLKLASIANLWRPEMNIQIKALATSRNCQWQVQIDQQSVNFRSESEARAFVDKLRTRLQAPHRLPERIAG